MVVVKALLLGLVFWLVVNSVPGIVYELNPRIADNPEIVQLSDYGKSRLFGK